MTFFKDCLWLLFNKRRWFRKAWGGRWVVFPSGLAINLSDEAMPDEWWNDRKWDRLETNKYTMEIYDNGIPKATVIK